MSNIKQAFVSRYKDGAIIEIDWSQLEICVLQIVSRDPELRDELNSGIDLHTMMTSKVFGVKYSDVAIALSEHDPLWAARRRETKRARFALQYGASAARISALTNWTLEDSKDFIKKYYDRYKGIAAYHAAVKESVTKTAKPVSVDGGVTTYKGQYVSPNGRRYVFVGVDNGEGRGIMFSGTQLKNYPIQGLASDFVKRMAYLLWRDLYKERLDKKALVVNTIHDSVVLDVDQDAYNDTVNAIRRVYDRANREWGKMCPTALADISFKYSISYGTYWSK